MKLKRTLTIAILAAVLSANLASCVADKNPADTMETYTDDNGGRDTLPIKPTDDPSKVEFETVSKTVYVSVKTNLEKVNNREDKVAVAIATELTVTAQSKYWYKVSYSGAEYFISRGCTTVDDLAEKTFTACDKTMYINSDGVNVRPYPSLESFSDPITQKTLGEQVRVIKQSTQTGWSKVEFTQSGKTVQGFVKTSLLTSNPTGEKDYEKQFTALATPKTVYVVAESQLALRKTPYLPDDENGSGGGIIVGGKGVPRGTAVTAIAQGSVNGVEWYKVEYQPSPSDPVTVCYGVKKYLSETKPSDSADPEALIKDYNFTKFDGEITAYPVGKSVNVRNIPTTSNSTVVSTVTTGEKMFAIAYGKSTTSSYIWCLVRLEDGKYGFASYEYLTISADGKKNPLPLSLDAMISSYGLERISETKTSKYDTKLWSSPDGEATPVLTKPSGTSFEIVAKGRVGSNNWYLVKLENVYYFTLQSAFN